MRAGPRDRVRPRTKRGRRRGRCPMTSQRSSFLGFLLLASLAAAGCRVPGGASPGSGDRSMAQPDGGAASRLAPGDEARLEPSRRPESRARPGEHPATPRQGASRARGRAGEESPRRREPHQDPDAARRPPRHPNQYQQRARRLARRARQAPGEAARAPGAARHGGAPDRRRRARHPRGQDRVREGGGGRSRRRRNRRAVAREGAGGIPARGARCQDAETTGAHGELK